MNTGKALLFGSITRVSQTFISICVAFVMMPFLIDGLGDYWYGMWTVIAAVGAAYHLFDLGMASAVARYVSHAFGRSNDQEANEVINTALGLYVAIAAVLALFTLAISLFPGLVLEDLSQIETVRWLIIITGFSVALEFPFNCLAGVPQAKLKFHYVASARIVFTLFGALGTYFAVKLGYGVVGIAVVGFIVARCSNLAYFFISKYCFKQIRFARSYFKFGLLRELFGFSLWSFLMAMAQQGRDNVGNIVVAMVISVSTVTHFVIATRLSSYLAMFLNQATNMFTPIFTTYVARGELHRLQKAIVFVTKINLVLAASAAAILSMIGKFFIIRWVGNEYIDSYPVLNIFLIATVIYVTNQPLVSALLAGNKHSIVAKLDGLEVVLNFVSSLILGLKFGMVGVALGTLFPVVFLRGIVLPIIGMRTLGFGSGVYFRSAVKAVVAVVLSVLVIHFWLVPRLALVNYAEIFSLGLISGAVLLAGVSLISFEREEKRQLYGLIPIAPIRNALLKDN